MWLSIWSLITVFVMHSPTTADDEERYACGTSLLLYDEGRHDQQLPKFYPSKYIADDPKDFKPFKVHFVVSPNMSKEMKQAINETTEYVNRRLSNVLKAPPVKDVRVRKTLNATAGQCAGSYVPEEYTLRCPASGSIQECDVPATDMVTKLNKQNDITLVVFVEAENSSDEYAELCHSPDYKGAVAMAKSCQKDLDTNRPTHGQVGICTSAEGLRGKKAELVVLHEIMHIVLADNVFGRGSPRFNCTTDEECENVTYRYEEQSWLEANGTRTNMSRQVIILENVKKAAQEYFRCPSLEGAEAQLLVLTPEQNASRNWTLPTGAVSSGSHWSGRLFPDELMNPYGNSDSRLSTLTLSLLKELGWYEVNMSAAEPMELTRPMEEQGCVVAEENCRKIIQQARNDRKQAVTAELPNMGPYCDIDYGRKDRIDSLQCVNDIEPLECFTFKMHFNCPTIVRPTFYDSFRCDTTKVLPGNPVELGATVGPGTICVSVGPVFVQSFNQTRAFGLCVQHRCNYLSKKLQLILRPYGNGTCEIECEQDASNQKRMVDFTNEHCKKYLGDSFPIICPNYTNVCSSSPDPSSASPIMSPVPDASTPEPDPGAKAQVTSRSSGPLKEYQVPIWVLVLVTTVLTTIVI